MLVAILVILTASAAHGESAEAPVVGADINAYYHDADFERWREIFESPGREVYDQRFAILDELELRPGLRVADVGAGTGLYTMLMARAVGPSGQVYAVDVSESFVTAIGSRAQAEGLGNVVPLLGRQKDTGLAPASLDLVLTVDTYHHFEYPRAMLDSIHAALVPNGVLAIIDYQRIPGLTSRWIMGHVRAGRDEVIEEVEQAGFKLIDEPLRLRGNYFLRFRKQS